ncbi:BMP family ABC transporter substrate-binding protein [Mycoplasma sp. CR]|uniref:BMP family ABC transporter substrate-binding protein n=1 Tax=Mycoplasma sp. CR TaxID=3401693 RepID=UPI003AAA8090
MKKFKSLLMAFAGITAATLPIVAASCGDNHPVGYIKSSDRVGAVNTDNNLTYSALQEALAKNKKVLSVKVVTDTGFVTDRSFNQSTWEGALTLADQIEKINDAEKTKAEKENKEFKPIEFKYSKLEPGKNGASEATFKTLAASSDNVWILSGFTYASPLASYLANEQNVKALNDKGVIIIGVDFGMTKESLHGFKNFYGLEYIAGQAAYVVGQAVAEVYTNNNTIENKTVAAFGGMDIFPVDSFIIGYLQGILDYNTKNKKSDVKVKTTTSGGINLDATFAPGNDMNAAVNQTIGLKSQSIMPVAGSGTSVLLNALSQGNYSQTVIGVDVNQALAFPAHSGRFVTSVTKNITQSVYDTLLYVLFGLDSKKAFTNRKEGEPLNVKGTLKMDWVGTSKSTLSDKTQQDAMNAALTKYTNEFKALNDENTKYIGTFQATKTSPVDNLGSTTLKTLAKMINDSNVSAEKQSASETETKPVGKETTPAEKQATPVAGSETSGKETTPTEKQSAPETETVSKEKGAEASNEQPVSAGKQETPSETNSANTGTAPASSPKTSSSK